MKRIFIAVDFTEITPKLIAYAQKLAMLENGKIYIIHAENYEVFTDTNIMVSAVSFADYDIQKERVLKQMKEMLKDLQAANIDSECILVEGSIANAIIEKTKELKADILIVGSHHHSKFYHMIMGNIHESFISKAVCPVLVVPPDDN